MFNFYNELLTGLLVPKKAIVDYERVKGDNASKQKQINTTRNQLIGSHQFAVSNSLLNHAVEASYAKPKSLLEMSSMSIPPFQNMFIEWDERKRTELILKKDKFFTSERNPNDQNFGADTVGYHIYVGENGCYFMWHRRE